jgi:methyltransferase family protein
MMAAFGTVLGTEPEVSVVDSLRERRGHEFEVMCHRVPEPLPGRYHVMALLDVLEHISDDSGTMRWAAHHLEPGGILVVAVPAFQFLWTEQDDAAHHFRRYTKDRLVRLLPPSLSLEHVTYFNTLLFAPILAARVIMQLIPRGNRPPRAHLGIPPEPFNWLFYQAFRLDRRLVSRQSSGVGVSILMVARRNSAPAP